MGETFAGVDYATGLDAAEEIRALLPGVPMSQFALRWILMFDAVTCAIPGGKRARAGSGELSRVRFATSFAGNARCRPAHLRREDSAAGRPTLVNRELGYLRPLVPTAALSLGRWRLRGWSAGHQPYVL